MLKPDNLLCLKEFARTAQLQLDTLDLHKRVLDRYPFDHIAEETLSKCFALVKSAILLVEGGQQDEAFGLARSLVEAALNLRWMTADRAKLSERSFRFVNFSKQERQFWYWHVQNSSSIEPNDVFEAERIATEYSFTPQSQVDSHWSGIRGFTFDASVKLSHPVDHADFTRSYRKTKQDVDYFTTSCYVHCSQPGLDDYFYEDRSFRIRTALQHPNDRASASIFICNMYLRDAIQYALYGMNVWVPFSFDCLHRLHFEADVLEYRFR